MASSSPSCGGGGGGCSELVCPTDGGPCTEMTVPNDAAPDTTEPPCYGASYCAMGQVCCYQPDGGAVYGCAPSTMCAPGRSQYCTTSYDCAPGQACVSVPPAGLTCVPGIPCRRGSDCSGQDEWCCSDFSLCEYYQACSGGRLCVTSSDCFAGETCNPGYWTPSRTQCGPASDASVPSDGTDALDDQSDSDSGAVEATNDASADAGE
jgi:hypothetical protein